MPNKPLYHPNERVDLEDFVESSRGYTDSKTSFDAIKQFLGKRSRLLEGFRVEIPDQTVSPGEFTVHNGVALDKAGRPLNNEASVGDSRTDRLVGTNTFYVELEFVESPSNKDSRAFWDPTFPNTDPIVDGKEFNLPDKATRLTPDWRIVKAINTDGFEADRSNALSFVPNSNRIPLMVLTTNGANEIVVAAPLVQVAISGVLEEDAFIGDSELRLLNSRLFPVSGASVDVGFGNASTSEVIAINGNDRVNGVITLGAGLGNDHKAGAIVRIDGGSAEFVRQRIEPVPDLDGSSHPDAARRQFQADERRGRALTSSKDFGFDSRDDLNIETLKDQVDALSAIILEMKFGSRRPDELGTLDDEHFDRLPPNVVTAPRWWDMAGSLMGVRTATLTVGDGIGTFGDFNGTDHNPFQDAVDNLPAGGGTIYIKGGSYTLGEEINYSDKSVVWEGESADLVTLTFTSDDDAMFDITTADSTVIKNMTLTKLAGDNFRCLSFEDVLKVTVEGCIVIGEVRVTNPSLTDNTKFSILNSVITSLSTGSSSRRAVRAVEVKDFLVDNSFIDGEYNIEDNIAPSRFNARCSTFVAAAIEDTSALHIEGEALTINAINCTFAAQGGVLEGPLGDCDFEGAITSSQRVIRFEETICGSMTDCVFVARDGLIFEFDDGVSSFSIKNSKMITVLGAGLINTTDLGSIFSNFVMEGIEIFTLSVGLADPYDDFILLPVLDGCSFRDIRVVDPLVPRVVGNSFIRWGDEDNSTLGTSHVTFENIYHQWFIEGPGISLNCPGADGHTGKYAVNVKDCSFFGSLVSVVCRKPGILLVDHCTVDGLTQGVDGVVCGPRAENTSQEITIRDNTFKLLGSAIADTDTAGVRVVGADSDLGGEFGSTVQDQMFASLVVKHNLFSGLGFSVQDSATVSGVDTAPNTRMSKVLVTGNEFDRLDAGDDSVLRGVLVRGFGMEGVGGGTASVNIFDNNFHDQGNDGPTLDNGFVDISKKSAGSITENCMIHDNTMDNLLGGADGLFAIQIDSLISIFGASICRNTIRNIGQATSDFTGDSGAIHVVAPAIADVVVSENHITQITLSSIPGIRIRPSSGAINVDVSRNTVVCSLRTWRPIHIGTPDVGVWLGTTVIGNTVSAHSQLAEAAQLDASLSIEAISLTNTVVCNNNLHEAAFLQSRASLVVAASGIGGQKSTGLVCTGNITQMPDPGAGLFRNFAWIFEGITRFNISNNMVQHTLPTADSSVPLGISGQGAILGAVHLTETMNFGLLSTNYITPNAGVPVDNPVLTFNGTSIAALSNLTGTIGATGIIIPVDGRAKQSDLDAATGIGITNAFDTTGA